MKDWEIREEIVRIREKYTDHRGKFTGYNVHDGEIWDLERKCSKSIDDIENDVGILYGDL